MFSGPTNDDQDAQDAVDAVGQYWHDRPAKPKFETQTQLPYGTRPPDSWPDYGNPPPGPEDTLELLTKAYYEENIPIEEFEARITPRVLAKWDWECGERARRHQPQPDIFATPAPTPARRPRPPAYLALTIWEVVMGGFIAWGVTAGNYAAFAIGCVMTYLALRGLRFLVPFWRQAGADLRDGRPGMGDPGYPGLEIAIDNDATAAIREHYLRNYATGADLRRHTAPAILDPRDPQITRRPPIETVRS